VHIEGCGLDFCQNKDQALDAAKNADYIVVCLGEKTYAEMMYNLIELYSSLNTVIFTLFLIELSLH